MNRMMTAAFAIAFLGAGACNQQPAADANVEAPGAEAPEAETPAPEEPAPA